jgi:hypothetical protein
MGESLAELQGEYENFLRGTVCLLIVLQLSDIIVDVER